MSWSEKLQKNRASGVIVKNHSVLLIHRFSDGKEYWVLPGGAVEAGETNEEALDREMKEELCIEVKNKNFLFEIEYLGRKEYHYSITEYIGEPKLGGLELERSNSENQYILTWVPLEKVKEIKVLYPKGIVEKIIN